MSLTTRKGRKMSEQTQGNGCWFCPGCGQPFVSKEELDNHGDCVRRDEYMRELEEIQKERENQ